VPRAADTGHVSFPKLFRRVAAWRVLARAQVARSTFDEYLKTHPDDCYATDDFVRHRKSPRTNRMRAAVRKLVDFVNPAGHFTAGPAGLVYAEAKTTLRDTNGRRITSW